MSELVAEGLLMVVMVAVNVLAVQIWAYMTPATHGGIGRQPLHGYELP